MQGYLKIMRGWMDEPYFRNKEYSDREAFYWILENAVFKSQIVIVSDKTVSLQRGQCCFSLRFLAEKWQWSEKEVRGFLGRMKKCCVLDTDTKLGITVISVCNYEKIQCPFTKVSTLVDTAKAKRGQTEGAKKNKGIIKDNKRKKDFSNFDFLKDLVQSDSLEVDASEQEFIEVMRKTMISIGENNFYNWFNSVKLIEINEEESFAKISFKSKFIADSVKSQFENKIESAWKVINDKIDSVYLTY